MKSLGTSGADPNENPNWCRFGWRSEDICAGVSWYTLFMERYALRPLAFSGAARPPSTTNRHLECAIGVWFHLGHLSELMLSALSDSSPLLPLAHKAPAPSDRRPNS